MKETFFITNGKPDVSSIVIWTFLILVSLTALFTKLGYDNSIIVLLLTIISAFTIKMIIESIKLFKS